MRACILFDIDGTLIDSTASDSDLYRRAVRAVLGPVHIRPRWHDYRHVTDAGILRELCDDNGLQWQDCEQPVRTAFGQLVAEHLRQRGGFAPIPGALALFRRLQADGACRLGIATGGWGHTARLKLDTTGYPMAGVALASSDDHHERAGIMALCRAALGGAGPTVYVGDGDWDRQASEQLGWPFIGVGATLRGRCAHWLPDLSQASQFEALLGQLLQRATDQG